MRTASGLAMVVVVALLLAAAGGALKFYMDRQAMQAMIADYGRTLAALPLPPGPAVGAFADADRQAEAGDYAAAQSLLRAGAAALGGSAPAAPSPGAGNAGLPTPPPAQVRKALDEMPPKARTFFEKHRRLLQQAVALRMMIQSGCTAVPKEEVRKITDEILRAAAAGDREAVRKALAAARKRLGTAGPPPPGPANAGVEGAAAEQLKQQLAEARGLVAQAQKAGVDPAPVVKLLDQAEALLSQGRLPETAAKMQEAFGVMREMAARFHQRGGGPGGRGRMRGGPGPGPGPDPGFVAQLAGALVGQLQSESPVLHSVMEDLDNAGGAMLDKNPGQVREILARATNKLTGIRESRNALSDEIARAEKRAAGAHSRGRRPSTSPGEPPTVPQPHPDLKPLRDLLGRAFDEVRTLSPEEYGKRKDEFVRRLVGSLLGPTQTPLGPPGGPVAQTSLPPIEAPAEEPTKPEERDRLESVVRDRLRLLQEPYTALGEAGVDMQDVGRLIQQARTAVNEGRLREAAQSANHASDLVCQLVDLHRDELQKQ